MSRCANILLVTGDHLRADALGCYGNDVCQTPNIDALADSGVVFENSFTTDPVCVPARASITTGNYPHIATGYKGNGGSIRPDQIKLAEHFASHEYKTYACGKLHYMPYSPPDERRLLHGFQHCDLTEEGRIILQFDPDCQGKGAEDYVDFLAENGWAGYSRAHGIGNNDARPCPTPLPSELHVDHWVATRTIQRLTEHRKESPDKPFLIWCSFVKPHPPYDPPVDYAGLYDPRQVQPPIGDASMLAERNPEIATNRITHGLDSLSPQAMQVIKAYYYGLVTFQDAQFGRIVDVLKKNGMIDDTIIIYTSDHGDLWGDFGGYFKANFLQGSVHVPLIMKAPGVAGRQRRNQPVGLQDILPTLAALTGCPLPQDVQGVDLSDALGSPTAHIRDVYYSHYADDPYQAGMICDGSWKYCYAQQGPTEELYHLEQDPHELVNLASGPGAESLLKPWRARFMEEACALGDNSFLQGKGLCAASLDRAALSQLPIEGMGWRWY